MDFLSFQRAVSNRLPHSHCRRCPTWERIGWTRAILLSQWAGKGISPRGCSCGRHQQLSHRSKSLSGQYPGTVQLCWRPTLSIDSFLSVLLLTLLYPRTFVFSIHPHHPHHPRPTPPSTASKTPWILYIFHFILSHISPTSLWGSSSPSQLSSSTIPHITIPSTQFSR